MSRFDEIAPKDKPKHGGRELGGSFSCQECDEVVTVANHNYAEQILAWTCSNGHVSTIGFKL
jgi:hypothetical protein